MILFEGGLTIIHVDANQCHEDGVEDNCCSSEYLHALGYLKLPLDVGDGLVLTAHRSNQDDVLA